MPYMPTCLCIWRAYGFRYLCIFSQYLRAFFFHECAKFRGSRAIVPSCLRGSEIFSLGYFVIPKFFLVAISWVQNFFSWALRGPKFFSRVYFLGPKLFSSVFCWSKFFSWVFHGSRIFFSSVFRGSKIFSRGYIVGLKYFPVGISVCSF